MKAILRSALFSVALLFAVHTFSQDSVRVQLSLQLIERFSLDFADNERLEIRSGRTNALLTQLRSDENGQMQCSFSLPTDSAWFYLVPGNSLRVWDENLIFEGITSDTIFNLCFDLYPRKMCWDSFLVPYIYFVPNSTVITDTTDFPQWVKGSEEVHSYGTIYKNKIKVISYCGYRESERLAKKRLEIVVTELVANGWPKEDILEEITGKSDLFICEYCDGCHYHYLKGKGITINRKILGEEIGTEKQRLESLRSCVTLEWYMDE